MCVCVYMMPPNVMLGEASTYSSFCFCVKRINPFSPYASPINFCIFCREMAWFVEDCDQQMEFACKYSEKRPPPIPPSAECPQGFDNLFVSYSQLFYFVARAQLYSTNTFSTNTFSPNISSLITLKLLVWSK